MPRLTRLIPAYRKHKASGQAVVTLNGCDCYLGSYGSKASYLEYDRLIGEWMQNGRSLPSSASHDTTVVEAIAAYVKFVRGYYVKDGRVNSEATVRAGSVHASSNLAESSLRLAAWGISFRWICGMSS